MTRSQKAPWRARNNSAGPAPAKARGNPQSKLPISSKGDWIKAVRSLQERGGTLEFAKQTWEIAPVESSPCNVHCPAGINVKGYLGLIAEHRFLDALELIRERNPFPGICGRVCTHPCEDACNRSEYGGPVAIRALKRFLADYELRQGSRRSPGGQGSRRPLWGRGLKPRPVAKPTGEKIAVVGAGPAGLTAAVDLVREGYRVTVFEASNSPGGMMRWAIPAFRLPKSIVKTEINAITAMGVEIKTKSRLGKDFTIADLKKKEFKAVFLALGTHKSTKLGIPGETAAGVVDALAFLRKTSSGKGRKIGKRVVVIGGGNSAVDVARTALRLGADDVMVLYRRSEAKMPAARGEIDEAWNEGVLFQFLVAPTKIVSSDGRVSQVECIHMALGEPDESGRARPIPIEGSEFTLDADVVIAAIALRPNLVGLENENLRISKRNTIEVNPETLETGVEGVFAGGDVVTGPWTIVEAIGQGHLAARSIRRFLEGLPLVPDKGFETPPEVQVPNQMIEPTKRRSGPLSVSERRRRTFMEVEGVLTRQEAVAEAKRCLRCGPCYECSHCLADCPKEWVVLTSGKLSSKTFHLPLRGERHHRVIQPAGEAGSSLEITDENGKVFEFKFDVHSMLAKIDPASCRSCGACAEVCAYDALAPVDESDYTAPYAVDEKKCKGCGICLAVCPVGAVELGFYSPLYYSGCMERAIEEATR